MSSSASPRPGTERASARASARSAPFEAADLAAGRAGVYRCPVELFRWLIDAHPRPGRAHPLGRLPRPGRHHLPRDGRRSSSSCRATRSSSWPECTRRRATSPCGRSPSAHSPGGPGRRVELHDRRPRRPASVQPPPARASSAPSTCCSRRRSTRSTAARRSSSRGSCRSSGRSSRSSPGSRRCRYRRFATYNIVGGASWVLSMTLIGFGLGNSIPNLDRHIEKVIVVVVLSRSCQGSSSI